MAITLIAGSPSADSRSTALLKHIRARLLTRDLEARLLLVRELPAEDLLHGRHDSAAICAAAGLVESAEGVIVATPIYKAAAAGVLKAFLDLLGQGALEGKVIWPIAVGGSRAHQLAIDYSLKPVLAALGATHVLGTLYACDGEVSTGNGNLLELDKHIADRLNDGMEQFVRASRPSVRAEPPSLHADKDYADVVRVV